MISLVYMLHENPRDLARIREYLESNALRTIRLPSPGVAYLYIMRGLLTASLHEGKSLIVHAVHESAVEDLLRALPVLRTLQDLAVE